MDVALAFSPRAEETAPGTVVLDISGLDRLFGSPHEIARALAGQAGPGVNVAVAPNPDAAVHAARGFEGVIVLTSGKDLAPLPVEVLDPPEEILDVLDRWGIRTFGDLAGLPAKGIAERLGAEGLRLQQLARGEGRRPLRPREPPPVFAESLELDHPVELLEPLAFVLARLLDQLCHRLEERALAVQELRLVLKLEKGEHVRALRLPLPMRAPREFLKLLQLDLSSHPPGAPVRAVTIAAQPAPPRVTQEGLFEPAAPQAEKLEVTLARLVALVGEGHVGSPELIDTHRPGAFRMTEWRRLQPAPAGKLQPAPHRLAFRVYRPPLRVKVTLRGGRPVYISGRGPITAAAGPWRSSGEWWTASSWEQDSWDVLSGGVLYRLCLGKEGWVLEGVYD